MRVGAGEWVMLGDLPTPWEVQSAGIMFRTLLCSWVVAFLYPVHTLAQLQEMFVPSRPQVQPVSAMCLGFSSEAICAPKRPGMSSVFRGTGITWRSQGFLKLSCQEQGLIHKEMLLSHPPLGKCEF